MWPLSALIAFAAACTPGAPPTSAPDLVRTLTPAVDSSDDPGVVETTLIAEVGQIELDGVISEAWGYRDAASEASISVPGPLIEVAAGTRMVVHLYNQLPESTTLHFHGMRKPNEMDGTQAVQSVVFPGESFTYDFVVSDPGLFWYHPHVRTSEQVSRGLYGAVRVRGDGDVGETADRVLVLDDVQLIDGRIDHEVDDEDLRVGRMGNTLLVNGDPVPRTLAVVGRERWRILNTANSRYFELELVGHPWQVTGIDSGPVAPWSTETLRIAPGERYEVVVDLSPGEVTAVRALPVDRGFDLPPDEPVTLIDVGASVALSTPGPIPDRAVLTQLALPSEAETFAIDLEEGTAPNGAPIFYVNGDPWPFADAIPRPLGEIESWQVSNRTAGHHPFHLHGLFFTVRDVDGVPPPWTGLKDTVDIPPGATANLTVHYHSPGFWMFHTHILDHASLGMMGEILVQ